ncbi:PD-(D/E)XK motif protein [Kineococcus sp. R86509]|uniref:PD-(D/E)XK motif protein n=1 Tax=Kineococcus sp. R86509 TaxID=3093851 RepID=UPI0036D349F3
MTVAGLPSLAVVMQHMSLRSPAIYPLDMYDATFDIDPSDFSLGIRVRDSGASLPEVTGFDRLTSRRVYIADGTWLELRIDGATIIEDAYQLASMIFHLVTEEQASLSTAVRVSLERLQELLAQRRGLSLSVEVGLWGELFVLQRLITTVGLFPALQAWQGPQGGEHDFTLDAQDLEVKTTTSERRQHHITHLTQLEPVMDRPLWLISVQITRSTGIGSRTLLEQIEATRHVLGPYREQFDTLLTDVLKIPSVPDPWSTRWRLRSEPALFPVTSAFPGLTRAALDGAGFDIARLTAVEQSIDLGGWPTSVANPSFWPTNFSSSRRDLA